MFPIDSLGAIPGELGYRFHRGEVVARPRFPRAVVAAIPDNCMDVGEMVRVDNLDTINPTRGPPPGALAGSAWAEIPDFTDLGFARSGQHKV